MDSYGRDREVEKVKPFAERARAAAYALLDDRIRLSALFGDNLPLLARLQTAELLLIEATARVPKDGGA